MTREFLTGVYLYNTMLSVFTPVYEEIISKASSSVTEWCGILASNSLGNNGYQAQGSFPILKLRRSKCEN